ncbi:hypothetical protein VDGD_01333 [Verticillium dahliae]|nr:hypothetical protein VDGD_01333 [Verticillium dahliae]
MNDPAQDDTRERLKAALWFAVGQMVDEESMKKNRNATPQFIGALTEMVWEQIGKSLATRYDAWDTLLTLSRRGHGH